MEWLEIIELRSRLLSIETLENLITQILSDVDSDLKKYRIKFFTSPTIETDYSIQIEHTSNPSIERNKLPEKSKLAHHIDLVFKNYGLVNHKIWVKIRKNKIQK